jgi:hypothetical protein
MIRHRNNASEMKPESSPAIGIKRLADDYKQNGESTGKQGGKLTGMQSSLSASLRSMIIPPWIPRLLPACDDLLLDGTCSGEEHTDIGHRQ